MTPEQLYEANERFAWWTLKRMYPQHATDADMIQTARMGLWKACTAYNEARHDNFLIVAKTCIANAVNNAMKYGSRHYVQAISLDTPVYDGSDITLADIVPGMASLEDDVIREVDFDRALHSLRPTEQTVIGGLAHGETKSDIARRMKVSPAYVWKTAEAAKPKLAAMMG